MNEQEAIKVIKHDIEIQEKFLIEQGDPVSERINAYKLAVEALERQMPMRPIANPSWIADGNCPRCGNGVIIFEEICAECGQRLDWGDE